MYIFIPTSNMKVVNNAYSATLSYYFLGTF